MKSHLFKCLAFFGLQAIVLIGILRFDTGTRPTAPEISSLNRSSDALLEGFLRKKLYEMWSGDSQKIAELATSLPNDPAVSTIAEEYLIGPDNYLAALIDKDELLKTATGPRIVFLGGSGLAFGLDSRLIEDRYGYTPINYGLHIRIGPEFMLRHVAEHLRAGDVVVLCVEYGGMLVGFDTTAERRAEICTISAEFERYFQEVSHDDRRPDVPSDPEVFQPETEVTAPDGVNLSANLQYYADLKYYADKKALAQLAAAVRRSAAGVVSRCAPPETNDPRVEFDAAFNAYREQLVATVDANHQIRNKLYRRTLFNSYGDYTGHLVYADRGKLVDKSKWPSMIHTAVPASAAETVVANVERLNRFSAECQAKDVTVLFSYTPLLNTPHSENFAKEYAAVVERHLKIPVLFSITEAIQDIDEFYDSTDHLNWDGIQRRMTTLTTALDRHFKPRSTMDVREQIAERDRTVRQRYKIAQSVDSPSIH